jgi:hypothetical protein
MRLERCLLTPLIMGTLLMACAPPDATQDQTTDSPDAAFAVIDTQPRVQAPDTGFGQTLTFPRPGTDTFEIVATGPAVDDGPYTRAIIIHCVGRAFNPEKSAAVPGHIVVSASVTCDAPVPEISQQVGIYRGNVPVDSKDFRNVNQSSLFGQVAQPFCQNETYKGGTAVRVVFPRGFSPPVATGTFFSESVPITCGCFEQYPDVRVCGGLPNGYLYSSAGAALLEVKKRRGNQRLRMQGPAPATSGPCVDKGGTHYGVYDGGEYIASIGCCPCCTDSTGGPTPMERCAILNSL